MLYGNVCFRPRVIGCTFELAESVFAFCRLFSIRMSREACHPLFVYKSFTIAVARPW